MCKQKRDQTIKNKNMRNSVKEGWSQWAGGAVLALSSARSCYLDSRQRETSHEAGYELVKLTLGLSCEFTRQESSKTHVLVPVWVSGPDCRQIFRTTLTVKPSLSSDLFSWFNLHHFVFTPLSTVQTCEAEAWESSSLHSQAPPCVHCRVLQRTETETHHYINI